MLIRFTTKAGNQHFAPRGLAARTADPDRTSRPEHQNLASITPGRDDNALLGPEGSLLAARRSRGVVSAAIP
jgi:hypothetical protein